MLWRLCRIRLRRLRVRRATRLRRWLRLALQRFANRSRELFAKCWAVATLHITNAPELIDNDECRKPAHAVFARQFVIDMDARILELHRIDNELRIFKL